MLGTCYPENIADMSNFLYTMNGKIHNNGKISRRDGSTGHRADLHAGLRRKDDSGLDKYQPTPAQYFEGARLS